MDSRLIPSCVLEVQASTQCEPARIGRTGDTAEVRGVDVDVGGAEHRMVQDVCGVQTKFLKIGRYCNEVRPRGQALQTDLADARPFEMQTAVKTPFSGRITDYP